jgi:hypothetical protein
VASAHVGVYTSDLSSVKGSPMFMQVFFHEPKLKPHKKTPFAFATTQQQLVLL